MNTLRYVISLVLGIALPYAVQRWDRRSLPRYFRDGAWNPVSWASALYGFGPLSMIGWLWVTRHDFATWRRRHGVGIALLRSVALLLVGVLGAVELLALTYALDALFCLLVGVPVESVFGSLSNRLPASQTAA